MSGVGRVIETYLQKCERTRIERFVRGGHVDCMECMKCEQCVKGRRLWCVKRYLATRACVFDSHAARCLPSPLMAIVSSYWKPFGVIMMTPTSRGSLVGCFFANEDYFQTILTRAKRTETVCQCHPVDMKRSRARRKRKRKNEYTCTCCKKNLRRRR